MGITLVLSIMAGNMAEHLWELVRPGHGQYMSAMFLFFGTWLTIEPMVCDTIRFRRWSKSWKKAEELDNEGRYEEAEQLRRECMADIYRNDARKR